MKSKFIIRAACLLIAVLMLLPLASCGKKEPTAAKQKVTHVFRESKLADLPEGFEAYQLTTVGDKIVLHGNTVNDQMREDATYIMNVDGTGGHFFKPDLSDENEDGKDEYGNGGYLNSLIADADGNIYAFQSGGYYNEEQDLYISNNRLLKFAAGENKPCAEYKFPDETWVSEFKIIDGDLVFYSGADINVLDKDLNPVRTIDSGFDYINKMILAKSGIYIFGETEPEYKISCKKLDLDGGTVSEVKELDEEVLARGFNVFEGTESYDLFYNDEISVYGYDIATGTKTEVLNWINSDIDLNQANGFSFISDEEMIMLSNEYKNDTTKSSLKKLTHVPDDQIKEKYILTLGCMYLDYDIRQHIIEFNKTSEEYRIQVVSYGQNYYSIDMDSEDYDQYAKFNQEIAAGHIPDILVTVVGMPFENYASKGLFADLYTIMDEDGSFNRADYLENYFKAAEINGKLYSISPNFSISTVIAKKELVGGVNGWNMDEFLNAIKKLPEGSRAFRDLTRDNFLNIILTVTKDQFIDKNTGKCRFDSPDFIKILEFAKTLSEKSVYDELDWEEDNTEFYKDLQMMLRENKALCEIIDLSSFEIFWEMSQGLLGGDSVLIGFPNDAKNGNSFSTYTDFAISSKSRNKMASWEFIKTFLTDEYAEQNIYSFPIKLSALEKKAQDVLERRNNGGYVVYNDELYDPDIVIVESDTGENGVFVPADKDMDVETDIWIDEPMPEPLPVEDDGGDHWYYWLYDQQIDIGPMTREAVDYVIDVIKNTEQCIRYDEKVINIVKEEAAAYFSGQNSAQRAAEIIQSKVSIYVSENR